jgi:uncharacterized phage protein (TIGR01671 family)
MEIKFRAWNVLAGVMTSLSKISLPNTTQGDSSPYLMQFTGLLDKNGKEIYEGDIISVGKSFPKYQIIWNLYKANFMLKNEDGMVDMYMQDVRTMKIIGNIYENKALLGEK